MKHAIKVDLEVVGCPLGCEENDQPILTGGDILQNLPGKFEVVKCCSCGLMRTNPRPTPYTIGCYYPDDYGPYLGTQVRQNVPESGMKKVLKLIAKRLINVNSTNLPSLAPGRMLEIGCASGAFLHRMAGNGWRVHGIEVSPKAAGEARKLGYPVHTGPLETAPSPQEPFDLIVGWMVLEHLHDPIGGLRQLHEWAKPDAWLVLSVPNAGSLEFRLFKEKWYALQLPTHLHHFTPVTLEKMLAASGWQLDRVYHQRTLSNLIASTGYVIREKGYPKMGQKLIDFPERGGWIAHLLYPVAWLFSIFGQTGRMTVWAKVKSI